MTETLIPLARIYATASDGETGMDALLGGALCATSPSLFFAPDGETPAGFKDRTAQAFAICAACPVTAECRAWRRACRPQSGVWAGVTLDPAPASTPEEIRKERERQRHADRRAQGPRQRPAPEGPPMCSKSLHVMDTANTYVKPNATGKICRACSNAGDRRRRLEKKLTRFPLAAPAELREAS